MKTTIIALTAAAAMSLGSIALADETQGPVMLTDIQMDHIVAGAGGVTFDNDLHNIPQGKVTYVADPVNTEREQIRTDIALVNSDYSARIVDH